MKLTIERDHLLIEPESAIDLAYVEDTLNLRHGGDSIPLVRFERRGRDGRASGVHLMTIAPAETTARKR